MTSRSLIDALHNAGIGVLVDWVPAHFPKIPSPWANSMVKPATSTRTRAGAGSKTWGTYVFDFGRHEVRNFLVANALYWAEEFHIDGLRVDAVASMLAIWTTRAMTGFRMSTAGVKTSKPCTFCKKPMPPCTATTPVCLLSRKSLPPGLG